jgi:hypothetical protein
LTLLNSTCQIVTQNHVKMQLVWLSVVQRSNSCFLFLKSLMGAEHS